MICPRCKRKQCQLMEIEFKHPSGNNVMYDICYDCEKDLMRFMEMTPQYNVHGYNFKEFEQRHACDTMADRGIAKEWRAEKVDKFNCITCLESICKMFVEGSKRCEGKALEYQQHYISAIRFAIAYIQGGGKK